MKQQLSLPHTCEKAKLTTTTSAKIVVLSRRRDDIHNQLQGTEKEIERLQIQICLLQPEMSHLGKKLSESVGQRNVNYEADISKTDANITNPLPDNNS
jgi:peptidoglycan hydrolase CwlO-like protein